MSERFAASLSHQEHIDDELSHVDPDIDTIGTLSDISEDGMDEPFVPDTAYLSKEFSQLGSGNVAWSLGPSTLENNIKGIKDVMVFEGLSFKLSRHLTPRHQEYVDEPIRVLEKGTFNLDTYVKRKQGIATLVTWFQTHAHENSLNPSEAREQIDTVSLEYDLPENIQIELHTGLQIYLERMQKVSEVMKRQYSPQDFYFRCFSNIPKGDIEVEQHGGTILVRCMDQDDFAVAYGHGGKMWNVDHIWGAALSRVGISGLDHVVMIERKIGGLDSSKLIRHEHQHQINSLFSNVDDMVYSVQAEQKRQRHLSLKRFAEHPSQDTFIDVVKSYVHMERYEIEKRAKDEIIAQYSSDKGLGTVAVIMKYHDNYQYSTQAFHAEPISRLPSYIQREISSVLRLMVEDDAFDTVYARKQGVPFVVPLAYISFVVDKIFKDEYKKDIDSWIGIIWNMEKKGYAQDEIIGYLNTEALRRWKNMERRLPSKKKES